MKLTRFLPALVLTGVVAAQAPALYTISQPTGGDNFGGAATGQSFTPGAGVMPDPTPLTVLPLTHIRLYFGNSGANAPSCTTYLNIYDGNPNAGGMFVGSSYNYVDTNLGTVPGIFRTPIDWYFNNLPLSTTTEYWAVMSSTPAMGTFDIGCSLETHPRSNPNPYSGGSGLIAGVVPQAQLNDTRFEIEFYFGGQGSFTNVGCGGCTTSAGRVVDLRTQGGAVPVIGQSFTMEIASAPANEPFAAIVLGLSDPGGIDLGFIQMPGCRLHVDAMLPTLLASTNASGVGVAASVPVPGVMGLVGATFYAQPFVADASANGLGAVTGNAKRIFIGQ